MKKILLTIFILLLVLSARVSLAATVAASTCSRADVGTAVTAASSGDTVTVPAGSCTWTTPLVITKGVTLQGAGVGQTLITANLGFASVQYYGGTRWTVDRDLITYRPSNPGLDEPFRLTGFEFDLQGVDENNGNYALLIYGTSSTSPLTNIRIDHNKFKNLLYPGASAGRGYDLMLIQARGVIDHNEFTKAAGFHNMGAVSPTPWGLGNWQNEIFTPDDGNATYFENNLFSDLTGQLVLIGAGWGGRYVARYNTFQYASGASSYQRPFDVHGNSASAFGPMGAVIYGNKFTGSSGQNMHFGVWRGGEVLEFYNKSTGMQSGSAHVIWEEVCDNLLTPSTASDGQPMHISDSYFWNNRSGTAGTTLNNPIYQAYLGCATFTPAHNTDFWTHDTPSTFNGTSGMGAGTLAARPVTCTTGVGYWATNQSSSTVPDTSVGVDPSDPLSGTLYRCTSTNTWTSYYTPYIFPHPLATAAQQDTTPPERYNSTPGSLPSGTVQTTVSFTTNEDALCRYSTSSGVAYDNMVNGFATPDGSSHSVIVGNDAYTDNFDRADENPLNLSWTKSATTNVNDMQIISNVTLGTVNSTRNSAYYSADSIASNQYSRVTVSDHAAASGPIVRVQGGTYLTGYQLRENLTPNDNTLVITKFLANGSSATLDEEAATVTTGSVLEIRANGSTISGYLDNVLVSGLSVTDTTLSGGQPGVYQYPTVDGFTMNDWAGGGLDSALADGQTYDYYVRCRDNSINQNTNTDDYLISFTIQQAVGGGGGGLVPRMPYGVQIKRGGMN